MVEKHGLRTKPEDRRVRVESYVVISLTYLINVRNLYGAMKYNGEVRYGPYRKDKTKYTSCR